MRREGRGERGDGGEERVRFGEKKRETRGGERCDDDLADLLRTLHPICPRADPRTAQIYRSPVAPDG